MKKRMYTFIITCLCLGAQPAQSMQNLKYYGGKALGWTGAIPRAVSRYTLEPVVGRFIDPTLEYVGIKGATIDQQKRGPLMAWWLGMPDWKRDVIANAMTALTLAGLYYTVRPNLDSFITYRQGGDLKNEDTKFLINTLEYYNASENTISEIKELIRQFGLKDILRYRLKRDMRVEGGALPVQFKTVWDEVVEIILGNDKQIKLLFENVG